jgi:hypothetical protein
MFSGPVRFIAKDRPPIWGILNRIQYAIGLSDRDFSELLGLHYPYFIKLRKQGTEPSAGHVFGLADELALSFENLCYGRVDYNALSESYCGNTEYLPEKYVHAAFSRRRTSIPILRYLREKGGDFMVERELRYFQVHPNAFKDPEARISIRFITDLAERLNRQGFTRDQFFQMGCFSVTSNWDTPVARRIQALKSVGEIYELLDAELAERYDENFHYTLTRLKDGVAQIRVTQRESVAEVMRSARLGGASLCVLKGGIGAAYPTYLGLPVAQMSHDRCVHRGDSICEFDFDFSTTRFGAISTHPRQ